MKVLFKNTSEYKEGPTEKFNWKSLENEKSNLLFAYGVDAGYRMDRPDGFKHTVYYEAEEPNGFTFGKLPHDRGNWDLNYWTKILHPCPYSVKWENEVYNTDKFKTCNLFFDSDYNKENEKTHSVCYVGGLHGHLGENIFSDIANTISEIPNHRIVSWTQNPLVTDFNVTYNEKLIINSKTKITVIANLLQQTHEMGRQQADIKRLPNWQNNEAFKMIDYGIMPQIKGRVLEAAACKSLALVLYDEWNVIENFFTPNVHFLYYNQGELKERIFECLSNWEYCEKIISNMYDHYMQNYTIKKVYEKHLLEYDI